MKNLNSLRMLFAVVLNLFCTSIYAMDKYSSVTLPGNFGIRLSNQSITEHSLINNSGQVAGHVVSFDRYGHPIGVCAALWDAKKGIKLCPLAENSSATAVNDSGWVTVMKTQGVYWHDVSNNFYLWNSNTNELKKDCPNGFPLAISNNGIVLIRLSNPQHCILWNSKNNVMTKINAYLPLTGLTDNGVPCSEIPYSESPCSSDMCCNKSWLNFNPGGDRKLTWFYDGKSHFLSAQNLEARLNYKNDVVVAIEDSKIVKWHKNGKKTTSEKSYTASHIGGFVSSGKILLDGGGFGDCILLTPSIAPTPLVNKNAPAPLAKKKAPAPLIKKKASKALKVVKHKHGK